MKITAKKFATTLAAAGLMLATVGAKADIISGWHLNLSNFAGGGDAVNIDYANINGKSTVVQNIAFGSPVNQTFTDNGFLAFTGYQEVGGFFPDSFQLPTGYRSMYLTFSGLTGKFNAGNTITFDQGSGQVNLWLDSDTDANPATGSTIKLASFAVVAPSGGSGINFFGGAGGTATIDVTLHETFQATANLFQDEFGNNINPAWDLELVNVNSLIDPRVNPNPAYHLDQFGNGYANLQLTNAGQFHLSAIPEPGSVALAGIGLLGLLAGIKRRRA